MSATLIATIAEGFRHGLPHPGNPEHDQPAQTIVMPGMTHRGIPKEVLDEMAKEAGLPHADLPTLVAEALVNLIQTKGDSEIVPKSELEALRAAKATAESVYAATEAEESTETPVTPTTERQWATPTVVLRPKLPNESEE